MVCRTDAGSGASNVSKSSRSCAAFVAVGSAARRRACSGAGTSPPIASPRSCTTHIASSLPRSTSGNSSRSTSAIRQSRHECSATLSWVPSDVWALRVTTLSRSAARRNSTMPSRCALPVVSPIGSARRRDPGAAPLLRAIGEPSGALGEQLRHEALALTHPLDLHCDRLYGLLDAREPRIERRVALRRCFQRGHSLFVLERHAYDDDDGGNGEDHRNDDDFWLHYDSRMKAGCECMATNCTGRGHGGLQPPLAIR